MFAENTLIRPSDGHTILNKNTNEIINKGGNQTLYGIEIQYKITRKKLFLLNARPKEFLYLSNTFYNLFSSFYSFSCPDQVFED